MLDCSGVPQLQHLKACAGELEGEGHTLWLAPGSAGQQGWILGSAVVQLWLPSCSNLLRIQVYAP